MELHLLPSCLKMLYTNGNDPHMMMVVRSIYELEDRFTTMWAIAC